MTGLWGFQQERMDQARVAFRSHQSVLLQSPTGSGKTQMGTHGVKSASEKGNDVIWLAHRRELLEGTGNTFRAAGIPHSLMMGGRHHNSRLRVTLASVGTLVNRLELVRPPRLLITDECFPAGTLVDGIPIEHIAAGDMVTSFNHQTAMSESKPVVFPMSRLYAGSWYRIASTDGRSFVCTENHPVYVHDVGYVAAKCLREHVGCAIVTHDSLPPLPLGNNQAEALQERHNEVLQPSLQRRLLTRGLCQLADGRSDLLQLRGEGSLLQPKEIHGCQAEGQGVLLRNMQDEVCEPEIVRDDARDQFALPRSHRSTDDGKQSHERSEEHRDHGQEIEGKNFRRQGRERTADETAVASPRAHGTANGVSDNAEGSSGAFRVCSGLLQSGLGCTGGQVIDRGGRQVPPTQEVAISGCSEDRDLRVPRLASVEVYKRGSGQRPGWVPDSDQVYNLHVEGHNNYFANGILVHNCHHATASQYDQIIRWVEAHGGKSLGLTATPWRLSGEGLENHYQHMVKGPPVAWLIANGYLSDYRAYAPFAPDLSEVHTLAGDYAKNEIEQVMTGKAIVADCVSHWKRLANGKRTIGFAVTVEHSEIMVDEFLRAGIPAAHVDANTPEHIRRQHILNFATGHILVLFNVGLFSEGFDLSAIAQRDVPIECVIQARPTKSLTMHLQQLGRALRRKPYPAILIDLCGNLARLGLPDHPHEWTLEGRPKKGRGGKGEEAKPLTRKCTSCDVQFAIVLPTCPHCGAHQAPAAGRKVEEVVGELKEIDREMARKERLREQGGAKSLDELIELGRAKGYKSPEKWASHVYTARLQKQGQAG